MTDRLHPRSRQPNAGRSIENSLKSCVQGGERAKGDKAFWGFVWQGAVAEALTCNALEWQAAEGGGQIIEADKTISVNNPNAIRAWQRAARCVGSISPPSVVGYKEWDSQNVWVAGEAAFMRNWPTYYVDSEEKAGLARCRAGIARFYRMGPRPTDYGFVLLVIAQSLSGRHGRGPMLLSLRYGITEPDSRIRNEPSRPSLQRNKTEWEWAWLFAAPSSRHITAGFGLHPTKGPGPGSASQFHSNQAGCNEFERTHRLRGG